MSPGSKMGRGEGVIDGNERWVGFIGGGYNTQGRRTTTRFDSGEKAKGFFVVEHAEMEYSLEVITGRQLIMYTVPGRPGPRGSDNTGLIDRFTSGDLGRGHWRFRFCTYNPGSDAVKMAGTCGISGLAGRLIIPR